MSFKSSLLKRIRRQWYTKRFISSSDIGQNVNTANYVSNLSEILGCSSATAGLLLTRNKKILSSDLNNTQKVASFCRSNFRLSEVIELPEVLSLTPYELKDRTSTLRELGCCTITAGNVLFFKHFIQQTPMELYNNGFQMNPKVYFAHVVRLLKCPDDVKLQMTSKLLELHSKNFTLLKIKALINAAYLGWKLKSSEGKVMSALHKCSALCTKSLVSLDTVYDLLLEKFKVPPSKISKSLSLLTLDCENLEDLMTKVPVICGVNIQHVARKQPSVLRRPANSLIDTIHVLESHDVTSDQLLSCPKILNFSASTILSRLNYLKDCENHNALKQDESFLWLIFHFSSISENPKLAKDLKFTLQSLHRALIYKRLHSCSSGHSKFESICFYLAVVFDSSAEDVKKELKQYPKIYIASLKNAQKIVKYLTAQGVTKEQLWNGIGIVLYDFEVVTEYFEKLSNNEDLQSQFLKWIGHHNVIQLLIYEIEKEQSFTGNGMYMRNENNTGEFSEKEEVLDEEEILAIYSAVEDKRLCL